MKGVVAASVKDRKEEKKMREDEAKTGYKQKEKERAAQVKEMKRRIDDKMKSKPLLMDTSNIFKFITTRHYCL